MLMKFPAVAVVFERRIRPLLDRGEVVDTVDQQSEQSGAIKLS